MVKFKLRFKHSGLSAKYVKIKPSLNEMIPQYLDHSFTQHQQTHQQKTNYITNATIANTIPTSPNLFTSNKTSCAADPLTIMLFDLAL
jgi:hypothetical protein